MIDHPSEVPPGPAQTPGPDSGVMHDNVRGVSWLLFSVVTASMMALSVREMTLSMDSRMVVFLRAAIATAMIACIFLPVARWRRKIRFSNMRGHLLRGSLIAISTQLGFYAIANLPLAQVTILFFTGPIFATVLAGVIHKEKAGFRRWSAIVVGFLGTILILRPDLGEISIPMVLALVSSLLFATALILSRSVATSDGAMATYVSSAVITAVISLPLAIPVWSVPDDTFGLLILLILVLSSAARGYGDIEAYRYAEASILAPVTYLRLVLIGIGGWYIYDEVPDQYTIAGGIIIIAATLYIARREAKIRKSR